MEHLVKKFVNKTIAQGLADEESVLMGGLDDVFFWNHNDSRTNLFEPLFDILNINSFLYAVPREPYRAILQHLAASGADAVYPKDSETRTFLHDLPISSEFTPQAVAHHLKRCKGVLLPDGAVATYGTVSPEEAFVTFSSVCFAAYVKFMSDCLEGVRRGGISRAARDVLTAALQLLEQPPIHAPKVQRGPFETELEVHRAICEAGRHTVTHRLVDSHFGNVSALWNNVLYISQTGSSLEELESCIDPCALDGSSSASITASSELTAHRHIYERTGANVILHGHPRFCAILSLDCHVEGCHNEGRCHVACDKERFVKDIPIVPGEVGTGPTGLCNTVPPAMVGHRGVIVFGHGLFVAAKNDFQDALQHTFDIERMCMNEFIRRVS